MAGGSIDITELPLPTKKLASQSLTRGVDTVHQEEVVIGDGSTDGRIASVTAASALKVDGSAVAQPVTDNGGALTVDALDLDIRNLATGQDKVDVRLRDSADATFIDPVIKVQLPASLGQKVMASSLAVAIASDQTVIPVSDNASSLTVDAPVGTPVFVRLSDGAAALVGQKVMASSLPMVIASDQTAIPVTPPTLTKGTQGATGFSVQNLKDSGRVNIMWTAEFTHAQTAETLLTITESRDGAATSTFTSKVVTNGKRLRIASAILEVELLGTGTTPQRAYLRMRFNTAGAATTGSPLQAVIGCGVTTAIVKATNVIAQQFPDGIEFLGDGTKQIGFSLETPDWVVTTATGRSKITITAFEY